MKVNYFKPDDVKPKTGVFFSISRTGQGYFSSAACRKYLERDPAVDWYIRFGKIPNEDRICFVLTTAYRRYSFRVHHTINMSTIVMQLFPEPTRKATRFNIVETNKTTNLGSKIYLLEKING